MISAAASQVLSNACFQSENGLFDHFRLTAGRRNRMDKSLDMRACLKVYYNEIQDLLYSDLIVDCSVVND